MRLLLDTKDWAEISGVMDRVGSSYWLKNLPSLRRAAFESQSIVAWFTLLFVIQNAGLATASIMLPVIRSFSLLEGSGSPEGFALGMTAGHAMELRDHDNQRSLRHRRKLTTTIADFPLAGNEFPVGLYYTEIRLGTPTEKYYVQVDTGSDLLWVNCKPCPDCPSASGLQIPLRLYDPTASMTSRNTSCSSNMCRTVPNSGEYPCVDQSCYYSLTYGDGSTAMGYLVSDLLTYNTVLTNSSLHNMSATVVFGCGFNQSGDSLTSPSRAVDGIMGFGRQLLSVISQLADSYLTTNSFAHCLQGDTGQGGIFVIGNVKESGVVYTKLIANQFYYNVALLSISVGDTTLNIPTSTFDISTNGDGGTIFDSGTTMALLVDKAYEAFVFELMSVVILPTETYQDTTCFEYSNSDLSAAFPSVTLYFDRASMQLQPTNYLYQLKTGPTSSVWCLAWSRSSSSGLSLSILGDIVLKNKLVVYDLENEQIGWVDFDCTSSVHVSNGTGNQVVNPNLLDINTGSTLFQFSNQILVLLCTLMFSYFLALIS